MKLSRALKGINGRRYSKEGGEGEKDGAAMLTFSVSTLYIHIYVVYISSIYIYLYTHKSSLYTSKTQCVCVRVYDMRRFPERPEKVSNPLELETQVIMIHLNRCQEPNSCPLKEQ